MEENLKFTVESSKLICDVLKLGIGKLEVIEAIQLDESDIEQEENPVCHSVIDTQAFLPCREIQKAFNKKKFFQDFRRFIEILHKVQDELESNQTFCNLMENVDEAVGELLMMQNAMDKYQEQNILLNNLRAKLRSQKKLEKEEEAELLNENFQFAIMHDQEEFDLNVEKNFAHSWFESNKQQNELGLKMSEDEAKQKLLQLTLSGLDSEDISFKICKFYRRRIRELQEESDRISAEYFLQIDNFELKIQIALKEKKELDLVIEKEREHFARREKEMKDYHLKKRQKEADSKLLALQKVKIVVIQAWFRGLMVRQHLGRFKMYKKRARLIKKEFQLARSKKRQGKAKKWFVEINSDLVVSDELDVLRFLSHQSLSLLICCCVIWIVERDVVLWNCLSASEPEISKALGCMSFCRVCCK